MTNMSKLERTEDIFEVLEHYPKPPLISENAFDAYRAMKKIKPNAIHQFLIKSFLFFANYKTLKKDLRVNIEKILRGLDSKSRALFGPVVSATISIEDDPRKLTSTERAVTLILAARSFYNDLKNGTLEPDKYGDQTLEMGQYPNCFSTTQLIKGKSVGLFKSKITSQIGIIFKGRFFIADIGETESELNSSDLKDLFNEIITFVHANPNDHYCSPGVISVTNYKTQVKLFGKLMEVKENESCVEKMKDNFLVVCLDFETNPGNEFEALKTAHSQNFDNRWFHTSLQIVVFGNSKASFVCNFSNSISGNIMMRVAAELQKRACNLPVVEKLSSIKKPIEFSMLPWNINPEFIKKSKDEIKNYIDDQQASFVIDGIGRKFFRERKLNSVSVFVIVLQITIRNLLKEDARITQFVTLSKYRCMDLTTAMVTTNKTIDFIDALESEKYSKLDLCKLLSETIDSQIAKVREARTILPLFFIMQLISSNSFGWKKIYLLFLINITISFLKITGFFNNKLREVIISHPTIFEETKAIGRPGIRIPYVKYFGLHYQIMHESIVITLMPGMKWKIPNSDLISELKRNLFKVRKILE